jgi:hypothetical protein
MVELLRLATFLLFLALGWRARRGPEAERRRAAGHLVAYVLVLSALAGGLQKDDWPFTSHTIAVGRARADSRVCQTRFFALDAGGGLWRLDPYTFTPVYDSILQYWVEQALPRLDEAQRGRVLAFLLARAEESRRRLAAGRAIGPQRLLGDHGADYWLRLPRKERVPPGPYARLRVYSSCWTTELPLGHQPPPVFHVQAEWPAPGAGH